MPDLILDLARRHIPAAREITRTFHDGYRHLAFEIDDSWVVKVPRDGTIPEELETEGALLEALDGADLPVPRLIAFDDGPPPYMITTRVPGRQLSDIPQPWSYGLVRSIARGLAAIHEAAVDHATQDLVGQLDVPGYWRSGIEEFERRGSLDASQAGMLSQMLEGRWSSFNTSASVLTHGDFWPHHCIVENEGLSGFVDLADATMASSAWDLSFPWNTFFGLGGEQIVEAYRDERGLGPEFLGEVEFYSVFWALRIPRWAEEHNLGFRGSRTALSVLQRFFAAHDRPTRGTY